MIYEYEAVFNTPEEAYEAAEIRANAMSESNEVIEFEGHNCEEILDDCECMGWDGNSHRCECGNRRVSWVANSSIVNGEVRYYYCAEAN